MCLLTSQKEPILTDKDIICYKAVFRYNSFWGEDDCDFRSILNDFYWKKGVIYETNFGFTEIVKKPRVYDKKVRDCYYSNLFCTHVKLRYRKSLILITNGFHAFVSVNRVTECNHEPGFIQSKRSKKSICIVLVKCIIPKYSLVYYDKTGLLASNKMIMVEAI